MISMHFKCNKNRRFMQYRRKCWHNYIKELMKPKNNKNEMQNTLSYTKHLSWQSPTRAIMNNIMKQEKKKEDDEK